MIIGHGDIASVIPDRPDRLYFASGVSNSGETRESEFVREHDLLDEVVTSNRYPRHLVYFSSLSIFYSDSRYAKHKREMEWHIQYLADGGWAPNTIIRLGNITWGTNPHTLINFMRAQIAANIMPDIQDVYRYVVSKAEFLHWLGMIPDWSCEMNIPGRRMKVAQIVNEFVMPPYSRMPPLTDEQRKDAVIPAELLEQALGY